MPKSKHYRDEEGIKAFGLKVRKLRQEREMTIEQFANSVELHVTQLSRIERGESNPTLSYILLIAEKLGVSPRDLMPE